MVVAAGPAVTDGLVEVVVPFSAGTAAPALTVSSEVVTVKPLELAATAGPVVNWPAAKVIFDCPTARAAVAVVHTIFSGVPAVNAQPDSDAVPELGWTENAPVGLAPPEK